MVQCSASRQSQEVSVYLNMLRFCCASVLKSQGGSSSPVTLRAGHGTWCELTQTRFMTWMSIRDFRRRDDNLVQHNTGTLSSNDGESSQPVGLCAFYLLPHCLSVVTDVVATVSHRAWTTNRVFPLTDSSCWLSAKQGKKGRRERRGGVDWYKKRDERGWRDRKFSVRPDSFGSILRMGFVRLAAGRVGQPAVQAAILRHSEVFDSSWEFTDNYLRGRSSCFHPALLLQCSLQHTPPAPRVVGDKRFSLRERQKNNNKKTDNPEL